MSALFEGTPNWEDALRSLTGRVSERTTRRREINQDVLLTFDKDMTDDWHLNVLAGFNGNERKYNYQDTEISNLTIPTWFNLANTADKPTIDSYQRTQRLMGVLGQAEVAFKNMLYLTVTARNDWSSTLPRGSRSYFYPGATASWIFSEVLPENVKKTISYAKLRAAWGKTGNDALPYMTATVYKIGRPHV